LVHRFPLLSSQMTNQHPITPPPELVASLRNSAPHGIRDAGVTREIWLINHAYAAGADQELEACVNYIDNNISGNKAREFRAIRRPHPPSLKEQAFDALHGIHDQGPTPEQVAIIRRALEALDD
jgi:hypothetical protein